MTTTRRVPRPPVHLPPHLNGDHDADEAITRATRIVGDVHDDTTPTQLPLLTRTELEATIVALAAMVDPDRTVTELLAWTQAPPTWTPTPAAEQDEHRAELVPAIARCGPLHDQIEVAADEDGWDPEDVYRAHGRCNSVPRGEWSEWMVVGNRIYNRAHRRNTRAQARAAEMEGAA